MSEIGFSCATCAHYTASNEKGGICRRYPPQVMLAPGQIVGQIQPVNLFPGVSADAFCGEHSSTRMGLSMPIDSRLTREAEGEA